MSLIEQIRTDTQSFVSDPNGFGEAVKFIALDSTEAEIYGLQGKHRTGLDELGNTVNSKIASITVAESELNKFDYPVRDSKGQVSMLGHLVELADATGAVCKYVIRETYPDESFGIIVCILGDFV